MGGGPGAGGKLSGLLHCWHAARGWHAVGHGVWGGWWGKGLLPTHCCPVCPLICLPAELTDALDIWVEATGLLHEAECDQEEEAEAGQLMGKGGVGRLRRAASWRPPWRQ